MTRELAWPAARVAEALLAVARVGKIPRSGDAPAAAVRTPEAAEGSLDSVHRWLDSVAAEMGLEVEPVIAPYREARSMFARGAPALVPLDDAGTRWLAIAQSSRGRVRVIAPDLSVHRVPIADLLADKAASFEARVAASGLDAWLDDGLGQTDRARVRRAIAEARYGNEAVGPLFIVRPHPAASARALATHAGLFRTLAWLVFAYAAKTLLVLAAWFLMGRGALGGHVAPGWLAAWALAVLSTAPLSMIAMWAQGRFAIAASRLVKQRLLYGALTLPVDAVRDEGVGKILGRVLESGAIEWLAMSGSLGAVLALLDIAAAGVVLWLGGQEWSLAAFACMLAAAVVAVASLFVRAKRWTDERLALTHDLVERLVGHRTRLAQERPSDWHTDEDRALEGYLARSEELDTRGQLPVALLSRAWMFIGLASLMPAFVSGATPAEMAVGLGGVLLALQALTSLSASLASLAQAAIAWRSVKPLWDAARLPPKPGDPTGASARRRSSSDEPVLEARALHYRYGGSGREVLRGCDLAVRRGDRLLLEGSSGSGKSTLAAVLGGLRAPTSGILLLDGLDPASLGPRAWRRGVVMVPQFHENHVLNGSFVFNAMMGTRWPPRPEDEEKLRRICGELGLGDLLARMPGGIGQPVGETGWQLSHGERSRLYIARALMQDEASVVIFDESFGALDPMNLELCVKAVLARAETVIVIAHP